MIGHYHPSQGFSQAIDLSRSQLCNQQPAKLELCEDRLTLLDSRRQQVDAPLLGKSTNTQLI